MNRLRSEPTDNQSNPLLSNTDIDEIGSNFYTVLHIRIAAPCITSIHRHCSCLEISTAKNLVLHRMCQTHRKDKESVDSMATDWKRARFGRVPRASQRQEPTYPEMQEGTQGGCLNKRTVKCINQAESRGDAEISTLRHEGEEIVSDQGKADIFYNIYCHSSYPLDRAPYTSPRDLDFDAIPTAPTWLFPTNNIEAACDVRNPDLHFDEHHRRQLEKLNAPINDSEILNCMASFSANKNHGFGVHTKLLFLVLNKSLPFLCTFLSACLSTGHYSNIFKIAQIRPVINPDKDKFAFASFRQITLTGIMRTLFERIDMVRLIEYVIECRLISSMSIAGLKGKSAIDALNVLTSDVYRGWDR